MHWNRAGYARLFRVDSVIAIIAKIQVAAILGLEFIEVILGPAKDLKYYRCELFEGCLVCDLKVPMPIGKYEFGISRIPASVLYAEFEDVWGAPFLLRYIFLLLESAPLIVRQCPSSAAPEAFELRSAAPSPIVIHAGLP